MHKFTKVVGGEREKQNSCHCMTLQFVNAQCCEGVKSNLPSEHKTMHKFTKVSSGEREKQSSYH